MAICRIVTQTGAPEVRNILKSGTAHDQDDRDAKCV